MIRKETIGQRFMVGFSGTELTKEFRELVKEWKVANVILFKENIVSSNQLMTLCQSIQALIKKETGHTALISIDQEGGMVTRLPDTMINTPGAMAIAATGSEDNAFIAGQITARQLRAAGVNMNLAPVLDINSNKENPVIGIRSFSDNKGIVSAYGRKMLQGIATEGILSCAKHFPGHGDTKTDSHIGLPSIMKDKKELEALELVPFNEAIRANVPAIMTSHILFPKIEAEEIPATMSRKIITGILKNELHFEGLVISDCMEMDAIKTFYGTAKGVVAAMKAGVDMVCISHSAVLASEALEAVWDAMKSGSISIQEHEGSVEKILRMKADLNQKVQNKESISMTMDKISDNQLSKDLEEVQRIRKESIVLFSGSPKKVSDDTCYIGCGDYRATLASNEGEQRFHFAGYMSSRLGGTSCLISLEPSEQETKMVVEQVRNADHVVIGTLNGHLKKGQRDLILALHKQGVELTVVALRNPYDLADLPKDITCYAIWEYSKDMFSLFADLLKENGTMTATLPTGIMPVNI